MELFADPDSGVAGRYVVDRAPRIVSVVPEYENAGHGHDRADLLSIVMIAVQSNAAYSEFQYRAVAQRVRNMARQWHFEPDRKHILAAELGDLIAALDVNPVIVGPAGCVAVDALVVPRAAAG